MVTKQFDFQASSINDGRYKLCEIKDAHISAIERGDLSDLCHILEESEWDIRSEILESKSQNVLHIACLYIPVATWIYYSTSLLRRSVV